MEVKLITAIIMNYFQNAGGKIMMVPKGKKMTIGKMKQYFGLQMWSMKTVEVKVGNKFLDISDISVDIHGNVIIYTRNDKE